MDHRSCEECAALRRELRDAIAAERGRPAAEIRDLAAWLEHLDDEEAARIRAGSPVWRAWRNLVDHRARTGHAVSLVPSLASFESPN